MSRSIVEICNLALLRLGSDTIMSVNEKSKEASYCRNFYDTARRATLRKHPWGFGTKVTYMTPLAEVPLDYSFAYALPAGYLRVVSVKVAGESEGVPYTIREEKILVTNTENPLLEYIFDVTDPNAFDDQFVETLSHRLASEIAIPLTGKASLQKTEYQMFQLSLASATNTDSAESKIDLNLNQSLVEARN